ncbi:MAG: hypothetical protein H0U57_14435 [Tatlockia sp.]|nr:hypothetical protein [Tatlockia sp.]
MNHERISHSNSRANWIPTADGLSGSGKVFNIVPNGSNLTITTQVPTHPQPYHRAGIVVNSPWIELSSSAGVTCTPDGQICHFAQIANNLPITLSVTGTPGVTLDLILCLSIDAGLSCQHSYVQLEKVVDGDKTVVRVRFAYITNLLGSSISKCIIDAQGNLSNCTDAATGFTSSDIAFSLLRGTAYVVDSPVMSINALFLLMVI